MSSSGALFGERASAGPEHLDPAYVAAYDRKARFDADAAEEVRLLTRLGLDEHSTARVRDEHSTLRGSSSRCSNGPASRSPKPSTTRAVCVKA